jgi:regulator of replication initiation timing
MHLAIILVVLLLAGVQPAAAQQNFSCNYGTRGACLGYNDKIVERNSACFSEFTCDFRGFVCKAKFDDVVDEHDNLVRKYNELVRKHRELGDAGRELVEKNSSLVNEYNDLQSKLRRLALDYETQSNELQSANIRNAQLAAELLAQLQKGSQSPTRRK